MLTSVMRGRLTFTSCEGVGMQVGDKVEYREPCADEVGTTYTIIELNGDRGFMRANVDLAFPPTTLFLVACVRLVEG